MFVALDLRKIMGPRGAHCTASTSTAGRLRDGSSGQIWRVWWRDVWPNSYVDSTRYGLFRMPNRARVMFST